MNNISREKLKSTIDFMFHVMLMERLCKEEFLADPDNLENAKAFANHYFEIHDGAFDPNRSGVSEKAIEDMANFYLSHPIESYPLKNDMETLLNSAEKDHDMWRTLKCICTKKVDGGEKLPGPLDRFFYNALQGRNIPARRKGTNPATNVARDTVFSTLIAILLRNFKIQLSKNESTGTEKATCFDIVRDAAASVNIGLSIDAISKIWKKNKPAYFF